MSFNFCCLWDLYNIDTIIPLHTSTKTTTIHRSTDNVHDVQSLLPPTSTLSHSTSNTASMRTLSTDSKYDIREEFDFERKQKKLDREQVLFRNRYYSKFLLAKLQFSISNRVYQKLHLLCNEYNTRPPPIRTIKELLSLYEHKIPIITTEHGAYLHVRHAVIMLTYGHLDILDSICKSGSRTLHFRLCEDGTWIGKRLNILVSSLGWVDAGLKAQSASSLIPLAIVKIPNEDRLNLDNYEFVADPRVTAATTTIHDEEEEDLSIRRGGLRNHSKRTKQAAFRPTTTNNYLDDVNHLPTKPKTGRKTTKTKLPAIDRETMFSRWSAYDKTRGARTLKEHYEQVVLAYPKFGYIQKPLYGKHFDYEDIVVDILHMKLRICDQMLKHAIKIACDVTTTNATQKDALQQLQNAFTFFTAFNTKQHVSNLSI
ncbi:unnamed protein product [Didymodactylos carnosus]|uniref:Uncharacterized protein n=1 Tax=Didymodactylos carnosus TaxID=1234261 RepID=A0A815D7S0_9BILA|nr:unnamed protein product [Didymodactylos carnosus]CAF4115506.1 unnamed protein product [Didymodactylos carnosus]